MSFESLGLQPYLLNAVEKQFYFAPTPVQTQAIPEILEKHDVIVEAQTGTGKTAAFALPVIQRINELPPKKKKHSVLALTLVPTRELAIQVAASYKAYGRFSPRKFNVISLIGGENIDKQIKGLRMGVDVVVATPGRLLELIDANEIRLHELEMLILDEADRMLDLGFSDELARLLKAIPTDRQTMLFSATLPQKVVRLGEAILKEPKSIRVEAEQPTVEAITQRVIEVNRDKRRLLLQHLITTEEWDYALVFVASKKAARNLANKLAAADIAAEAFHGDLSQDARNNALRRFKKRQLHVLIATDLAARGIDIERLSYVVNFDLPRSPRDYVHRIGRTGRAGASGVAVTFIGHEDQDHFRLIEKRAQISLERQQVEGFELTGDAPTTTKGKAPVKGKRKSKKDKLREAAEEQQQQ